MIEQIIKLLNSDNTVSANRLLAHALGIKAALLFNSLVGKQAYYEKHSMLDSEGWFYSTIEGVAALLSLAELCIQLDNLINQRKLAVLELFLDVLLNSVGVLS